MWLLAPTLYNSHIISTKSFLYHVNYIFKNYDSHFFSPGIWYTVLHMKNLAICQIIFVVTKFLQSWATDMIFQEALQETFPKSNSLSYIIQSYRFSKLTLKMERHVVLKLTSVLISLNSQAQMGENQWSYLSKKTYKINK